jgi:signal peptidase II
MEKEEKALIKNKKLSKEAWLFISIVIGIVVLDQALKIWVQNIGELAVIPGILKFKLNENTSAAYGIGSNSTLTYVATNIVILGVIFKFITTQNAFVDTKLKVFLSFILAGGISNVIERVIRGYVTEFMDFGEAINFPVFNLADIFIIIGFVAMAAIFASFTVKEWRSKKVEKSLKDNDK